MKKVLLFSWLFLTLGSATNAQVIWSNEIIGASPNSANPFFTGSVKANGVTVSGIGRGSGITGRTVVDAYSASSWTTSSTRGTSDYYYFTLSPSQCTSINFSSFQYASAVSGAGPTQFELRSSVDNYATSIGTGTATGTSISLTNASFQNVTNTITFRLYGWASGNTGSTALFSINNFSFNGTVNSAPITITQQPSIASNSICVGSTLPALSVAATGTGTPSYQWYYSTTGNNYNGTLITGATSSTYSVPNGTTSSRYYYCRISYGACNINSETSGLNVVANGPLITAQPSTGTTRYICEGDVYVLTVSTSSTGVNYQWYSRTTTTGTGTLIPGATSSSYQVPTNVSSSLYYYCVLTNSCGSTTSSTSRRVRVTVMSTKPSIANQNVCLNGIINPLSVAMTGTFVNYNYAWYYNTTPSNVGGTLISGAASASYTPPNNVASSRYYYCVVAVIQSSNNTLQCSITSTVSGLITVSPASVGGNLTGGGAVLCSGNNGGSINLVGNTGNVTSWQYSTDNGVNWTTVISTGSSYAYSNLTANTTFRANVQSGVCPTANSTTTSLSVTPAPNFSISPASSVLCNGGAINLSLVNNGSNSYSGIIFGNDFNTISNQGQWSATTASGTLNWTFRESPYVFGGNTYNSNDGFFAFSSSVGVSGVANLISPTYNLTGLTSVTLNYRTYYSDNSGNDFARVYYSNNGGTSWSPVVFTQTSVGSRTGFSTQSLSIPAIYLTSNFKVRFEYTGNNDRYWAIDNINVLGTATGFTYAWTPTDGLSAVNTASTLATVNSSVSYTGTVTNAFGCSNSYVSSIEVDFPTDPTISVSSDFNAICEGDVVIFTALPDNAGLTPTLNWQINGVDVIGATQLTYSSNSLSDGDIVTCRMTATNGCGQTVSTISNELNISVTAAPAVVINGSPFGCGSVNLVATGADTYSWDGGISPSSATNTFNTSGTYTVIGQNVLGCEGSQSITVNIEASTEYFADADGDLYGDPVVSQFACTQTTGFVTNDLDCNDSDALISPSGTEECNGVDDDCSGVIDDELPYSFFYRDFDGDGYGDINNKLTACLQPLNYVTDSLDCVDTDEFINPSITELCNGVDDNCDGQTDEGVLITSFEDVDGDGFGDSTVPNEGCSIPVGYVLDNTDCDILEFTYDDIDGDGFGALPAVACGALYDITDCDPNDTNINPAAQEICDGVDNDCDLIIDNGVELFIYVDGDGDGFGDPATEQLSCTIPVGFSDIADDCDDTNGAMFPLNPEVCDAFDNDCNGLINDGIENTYFVDGDGDGYGSTSLTQTDCVAPSGYVSDNTDCDDALDVVNPGQMEICDLLDNNCDDFIDEGFDGDGDGVAICNGDCDDTDPSINGFVTELCDGIDNNCDDVVDEGFDLDFDGFTTCNGDCNDSDDAIGPGISETCDGLDNDCDGSIDNGVFVTPSVVIASSDLDNTICAGESVTFTATPTNGGTTPAYQWKVNGTNAGTNAATFTTTTLANNDAVTVVMTANNACQTSATAASNSISTVVNSSVTPSVVIASSDADNTICAGESVTFTATPTNGGTTPAYQWKVNGTNAGTNAATFTTTTLANNDAVTVVMTANNACQTSATATSNSISTVVNSSVTPSVVIASSDAENTICAGESVTFTATPTNGGTTPAYQWQVNGTNAGTNAATFTTTTLANNDAVTVVMTANNACQTSATAASNSVSTVVNSSVTPSVVIASSDADNTICAGESVTFTATPTNGGTTPAYQWQVNGTNAGTNAATFTTTTLANNDAVTVVMTANNACQTSATATSNSISTVVNSSVTPSVVIASSDADNTICAGESVTFTATPTNGGTTPAYQWQVNGTNAGTNAATFTTTTLANNDAVMVVMTANNACQTSATATSNSISTVVNSSVTPSVVIASSDVDNTICAGESVTFTATPTNGGTTPAYQWKVNGTNAGTNAATFTTTTLANNDAVTVVMTANNACQTSATAASNSVSTVVNSSVTPSVVIASSDADNTICAGESVTFTATPTNGGTTPAYQWKVNGTNAGTNAATFTTTTLANNDAVTVVMTANNACQTSATATSNSISTVVNSSVTPSVVITSSDVDNTICAGESVTFTATPTNGGTTPAYQWQVNGTNAGTNAATFTTTTLANNDAVTVVMTANNACQTTSVTNGNTITHLVNAGVSYYQDLDGDTYGNAGVMTSSCELLAGYVTDATDCDDGDVNVNPSSLEVCNDIDDNCNAQTDEGVLLTSYEDIDGDGFGDGSVSNMGCSVPLGYVLDNTDCDVFQITYDDADGDGFGALPAVACGTLYDFTDCEALDPAINPAAQEVCNGVDDDCDLVVDNGVELFIYTDADGDGFGDAATEQLSCNVPSGFTEISDDCDDMMNTVYPGAAEICGNAMDEDCDGLDLTCTNQGCTDILACNYDPIAVDDDGSCTYPLESYLDCDGNCLNDQDVDGVCDEVDCDDNDPAINQNVLEACNGYDDNCDGNIDEGLIVLDYYEDLDLDGYGGAFVVSSCIDLGIGFISVSGDCEELNPDINPGVAEICNNIDDNCDGIVDEGFASLTSYADADGDGYGDDNVTSLGCQIPSGYVLLSGDCDDANSSVYTGAIEFCNGWDDNCDGSIDEGLSTASISATPVVTALYPTCSTGNLFTANMNLGFDSPITSGGGLDIWYSLTAQTNVLRVSLSAATGVNSIELYRDYGTCLELIELESESGVSNQILYSDQLELGGEYLVASRALAGPSNIYSKICFNHFESSNCDHSLVNNTGIYPNVCASFKVQYRGNAVSYGINVNAAVQNGVDLGIAPWSYTTPTASQIISRVGYFLPANLTTAPITYDINVDVTYALADAAGNMVYFTAMKGPQCQLTLNQEIPVELRSADRCPTLKSTNSNVYTDRQICGAIRYDWMFIRFQPSSLEPVIVEGQPNVNYLNLAAVPGMANSALFKVLVRPVFDNGVVGEWGIGNCLKTTATGMILNPDGNGTLSNQITDQNSFSIFPNPSVGNEFTLTSDYNVDNPVFLTMTDLLGNRVFSQQLVWDGANSTTVNVDKSVASGVYLVRIMSNGNESVIRWIKQ